jgi:hypothetical protein
MYSANMPSAESSHVAKVVPRRLIQLMLASMLAGALLGLYANHVRFGHAL